MFPDRSFEIKLHGDNAKRYFKENNFDMARMSYFKWVESIKQQNENTSGALENDLKTVQKEYSDFVKQDPLYINICNNILPKITDTPGILQTDIYNSFPNFNKNDLSYTLYFAADHGKILRTKKGRTYSLTVQ
jgi:hypothetical protein